ncbi:hypothetical protein [Polaribacter irgensii]|nr:hypothetical protein [Polaribacter irgensii]
MKILLVFLTVVTLGLLNSVTNQNFSITAAMERIVSDLGEVEFRISLPNYDSPASLHIIEAQRTGRECMVSFKDIKAVAYNGAGCSEQKNLGKTIVGEKNILASVFLSAPKNKFFARLNYRNANFVVVDKNVSLKIKL